MLAQAAPNIPCMVLLDDAEWLALYYSIHRVVLAAPKPPTMWQAVRTIA